MTHDGTGADGGFFADVSHNYGPGANPAVLPDPDSPERPAFIDKSARVVAQMLFRSAQNLDVASQLSAFTDVHLSQEAEGANPDTRAQRGLRVRKIRARADVTAWPNAFQGKTIIGDP